MSALRPIFAAALVYLSAVFAVAFAFGAFRTSWLTPRIGATCAVLVELPVILTVSWLTARALHRRRAVPDPRAALAMGLLAFAGLMALECALAVLAFGQSACAWAAALVTPAGLLGLSGQVLFALAPWAVWRR